MAKNRERIKALKDGIATLENDKEKLALERVSDLFVRLNQALFLFIK